MVLQFIYLFNNLNDVEKFIKILYTYVMRSAIWYQLYYFKNLKNTHGGVVKLQAKSL